MGESGIQGWLEPLFLLSLAVLALILLGSTGRLHLGFYNPYFLPPLKRHYKRVLNQSFHFHMSLPKKSKLIFEKRVQYFIHQKNFISREKGKVASDEQKVLIAAAAIQLTFGLPKVYLKHFKNILIYPGNYYSTITRKYHKGEVNPRLKAIVFSWQDFIRGNENLNDGVNLGLHEMAHALMLENTIRNREYNFISNEALAAWDNISALEFDRMKESPLFRDYALSSESELFPASVELFFERPEELQHFSPPLYQALTDILNQNPVFFDK